MRRLISCLTLLLIIALSCAPSVISLAESDPEKLVAMQDSLLASSPSDKALKAALVQAHLNLAASSADPEQTYTNALNLDPKNSEAKYHLALLSGHKHYKKGDNASLWKALEFYAGASVLIDSLGEAHYWMGRTYEKKDDKDFELIAEAYEKALALDLSRQLTLDARRRLDEVLARRKTFEEFWK